MWKRMFEAWKVGWRGVTFSLLMAGACWVFNSCITDYLPALVHHHARLVAIIVLAPLLSALLQNYFYPNPDYDFHQRKLEKEVAKDRWMFRR